MQNHQYVHIKASYSKLKCFVKLLLCNRTAKNAAGAGRLHDPPVVVLVGLLVVSRLGGMQSVHLTAAHSLLIACRYAAAVSQSL